jgi:hypothetical protein
VIAHRCGIGIRNLIFLRRQGLFASARNLPKSEMLSAGMRERPEETGVA